ncbi:MAG: sensor histidine kinase [Gemmatimonadaceae bacterium]
MDRSRNSRTTDILTKLPGFAALFATAAGSIVIAGWSLGIPMLTRMIPGFAPTPLLAGAAMVGSGAALWLVRDAEAGSLKRFVSAALAIFVATVALASAGEHISARSIDWSSFGARVAATPGLTGRLPINSAWGYFLVAIAIWTLCSRRLSRSRAPQWLGLAIFLTGFFALVGRAFEVSAFYSPMPGAPMSLWTMVSLQVLGIGVVFARRWFGFSALLMDKGPGGKLARRLLPPAIAMPFVVGWAALLLERAGVYGTEVGSSFFAVTIVLAFTWMVMRAARAVQRADAERLAVLAREQHEREVAEVALVTAEKASLAKSDFLAVMSHELRTPLTAIMGYEELLADGITGPVNPQQAQQLGRIKASAQHLLGLIDEVLTFSRIEAGRETIRLEIADVNRIIEDSANLVAPLAAEKKLGFVVHLLDPPRFMRTDPVKVRQMIVNLLTNAVKFTEAGTVSCKVAADGQNIEITVHDTGIGISAEHLDKVFDPFWQVEQKATRRAGGTGLGLTVTRRLARLLGGDVAVESSVGEGTTFRITIPGLASSTPTGTPAVIP